MRKFFKIFVLLVSLTGLSLWGDDAVAATKTSVAAGGNWNTAATWSPIGVPANGDTVIIAGPGTVAVDTTVTQTAAGSVTVSSNATLNATTGGTTVTFGVLTIASTGTFTTSRVLTILGATDVTGAITLSGARANTFTGNVTLNSGAVWTNTTTSTQTFSSDFTNNATTFSATGSGGYTFNGATHVLSGTTVTAIPTVTFTNNYTNSGTLLVSGTLTVTGAAIRLTNNGTITATTSLAGTGGLTQGTTGTLNLGGATTITTLIANAVGNAVNYTGAGQAVDTPAPATYYNLTLSGSGTKVMPAIVTVANNFTIFSGVGGVTAGTSLTVGGNWTETGPFNQGTGTVTLNGASAQTISGTSPVAFNNLTITNATNPNITLATNVTVGATLTQTAAVNLSSTCPADYTLTAGATVLHSCRTTTVADGTAPPNVTIAPGAAITDLDYFTLATNSGTDTASAVTVTLAPAGAFNNIAQVDLTDNSNLARCTAVTNPASNTISFTTCASNGGIPVTTTATTYKVRITPKTHTAMPPPPGASYATTGTVTSFTSTNAQSGSDSSSATVTIDNLSPNGATATSEIPGDMQVTLNWTTSSSLDFSRSVVLRWTGASAGTEVPAEGFDYVNGNSIGSATVACVRTADAASTAVSGVDGAGSGGCSTSILTDGQAYNYKVFQKDSSGNYDVGVAIGTATPTATPALSAYHMDEASWNGTANEVLDSGSGGFNGTAAGLTTRPTTSNASPAIAGSPGTCRYGVFNRSNKDYIALPGGFPKLAATAGGFTITAWINVANNTLPGQRILIDDETNASPGGWGFSVGETTTYGVGGLRFYYRQPTVYTLDTVPIPSGQWLFVALSVQLAAGANASTATIYAWNTAGTLVTSLTGTFTWTAGSDLGSPSIGGETNASGENTNAFGFGGNIDEVRVYQKALNQNTLSAIAAQTHPCAALDHLFIQSSGIGVTCTPSTLTVSACQDALCAIPYTLGVSGILSATGTPTVNWDGTTGGGTGAGFSIPIGLSSVNKNVQVTTAGNVVFGITAPSPLPTNPTTCNFGSPSCTFTVSSAGAFVVSVPSHVSCMPQAPTVTVPAACGTTFNGVSKLIGFRFAYVSPGTAASPPHVPYSGLASPGTALATGSDASFSLTFNGSGVATLPYLIYDDAGSLTLTANYAGSGVDAGLSMTGTSPAFVVAPASFAFSGIPAAPLTAGQAFNATVTAMNACATPAATPNFIGQTVTITSSNPQPALGNATTINTPLSGFSSGAASTSLTWNEVGTIDLNASLANYLGSTLSVSGTRAGVGRFKPAYFDTAVTVPGCSTFTYSSQPFTSTVTARSALGNTTANYAGSSSTSNATTLSAVDPVTHLVLNPSIGTLNNNTLATTDFVAGVGTNTTVKYTSASRQTPPTPIGIRAVETAGDSVSSSGHTEGTTTIYSGRARLLNVNGSEILDLPVTFRTEYWMSNIAGWQPNAADTCSGNGSAPVSLSLSGGAATSTCVWDTGSPGNSGAGCAAAGTASKQYKESGVVGFAGDFNLWLKAPGSGNTGSVMITSTVPAWLQYPWLSSTATSPVARATFGVYKSGPVIFRREMY